MLTINLNDIDLEKRIADKARSMGKSMQEMVEEVLTNALAEKREQRDYDALDPKEYGYYIGVNEESVSESETKNPLV
jgi:hypothetical protein